MQYGKREEEPAKGEKAVAPHGGYLPKSAKRAAADIVSAAAFLYSEALHAETAHSDRSKCAVSAYITCIGQQKDQPFWLSLDAWRLLTSCVMKYTGTPIAQRITERSIFFGAT